MGLARREWRNGSVRRPRTGRPWIFGLLLVCGVAATLLSADASPGKRQTGPAESISALAFAETLAHGGLPAGAVATSAEPREVLDTYCVVCHNQRLLTAGLALDVLDVSDPAANPQVWEKVIRKLRTGTMPPGGARRPPPAVYDSVATWLETEIDRAWAANPNPGRINAVHRLNATEYNNAVRDLLALEMDVTALLPGDETADGSFDNNADVLSITTAHLERYMSVARQLTRLATGISPATPAGQTFEVPLHVEQNARMSEDLPLGSRGGIAVRYQFPADGEYVIKVRLRRQYADYIMGMGWSQQFDVRLDGELLKRFTTGGEAEGRPAPSSFAGAGTSFGDRSWEDYMYTADENLEIRVPVAAGPRVVGVAFVRELWEPEGVPQPMQRGRVLTNDQVYMDYQAIHSVEIIGPYEATQPATDTPSRRQIFVCEPRTVADETACATEILARMARLAYRRPVADGEVQTLLEFFDAGRRDGGSFEAGVQFALERLLVDPNFLLRVYRDPAGAAPGQAYPLTDLELASRLSFFLWSTIPDETLLDLAESGQLTDPDILEQQVRRMLADPRATSTLVGNFAAQWLNLRRVAEVVVDPLEYPHFDENLLRGFQQETELFIASTLREDRSILDLLNADYTYLNERLARHYGIPGIYGSRFRRVTLPNPEQRGGLLAQGALLSVTSYPNRTSPVLRGKWLLENIFGSPPPPPPANVDTSLQEDDDPGLRTASIRERLAQHRNNPVCASCHSIIDPLGFALESFDVIGGWRTVDERGNPIDNRGTWPSGLELDGFTSLRAMLVDQADQFAGTLTEKLMAYALGRRLEYYDQPTVRRIVAEAAANDYRWSTIVLGIVESPAFLMRMPEAAN